MSEIKKLSVGLESEKITITIQDQLMSSCVGAVLTSLFVTPFDVVKTRLQVQVKFQTDHKMCRLYETCVLHNLNLQRQEAQCCGSYRVPLKGTLDAFVKISRNEGISRLWSGLPPSLFLSVPSNVIYFTMYDQFREKLSSHFALPVGSVAVPLVSGITARVLTVTIMSPIEFLRTKMQSEQMKYSDAFRSISTLVKNRGYFSLWRGLVPTILRDAPFSAIYWTIYEQLKALRSHPKTFEIFFFGAISGTIAAILTLPFDVIKTHQQTVLDEKKLQTNLKQPHTLNLLLDLYRQGGAKSLFAGIMPRVLKIAPACAIMISSYEVGKVYFVSKKIKALETADKF
ncbi:solute carrier family 25 member 40 [Nephila pilipes]|uniref:Solute carrier family 25 member 40 n=1 Tax=Nephila pilipes TaxID=299642 RepID=A0A8X6PC01_NEPPI|nr:solute carrier family 25 member 40 [Nephila pilipes]